MPPFLALCLGGLAIVALFREDRRTFGPPPASLWLPLFYFFILATRLPSQWMAQNLGTSQQAYAEGSPLDRIIYFGLLICSSWVLSRRPGAFRAIFVTLWPLTLYLAFTLISVLWSEFPLISVKRWIRDLGIYTTIGVVATSPDAEKALRVVFRRLSYLVLVLSTVLVKYYPYLAKDYDPWSGRAFFMGASTSKNGLGAVMLVCGLYLIWDLLNPYKAQRSKLRAVAVNAVLLWTCVWLLLICDSATSLLCLIIGTLLLALLHFKPRRISERAVSWGFVAALLAYVPLESVTHVTELIVHSLGREMTLTGRDDVWEAVLKRAAESPVLGVGYESFWLGERLEQLWIELPFGPNQAHNGYIEVYANLGIIGLGVALLLLCALFYRVTRALDGETNPAVLAVAMCAVFLFYNLTEAAIKSHSVWYAYLLLTMSVSARRERAVERRYGQESVAVATPHPIGVRSWAPSTSWKREVAPVPRKRVRVGAKERV